MQIDERRWKEQKILDREIQGEFRRRYLEFSVETNRTEPWNSIF